MYLLYQYIINFLSANVNQKIKLLCYRKIIFIGNLDRNALFKRIFSQNFPIKKLFDYALIKYTIVLIIKFSDKNDLTGVP